MLICIQCGKIIVLNSKPSRYGNCSQCLIKNLTEAQKEAIDTGNPVLDVLAAIRQRKQIIDIKDLPNTAKDEVKEILKREVFENGE